MLYDDQDPHSKNGAFNEGLAAAGYRIVITAGDGKTVTINSQDIIRNNNYIIANAVDDMILADDDKNWPLRLVGPSVSGADSIGNIVSIKLVPAATGKPVYNVAPVEDTIYTIGATPAGIKTMTVNAGETGLDRKSVV